ncbi:hypothetical protein ANME2D_01717 [Candidatus Methanoperedens nitroreducens]|uniref:Uncharacterized protein n=1 Tax=Candidatus Methanoperedens nitratireducens TaxID=1392998 RepID=A0A062UZF8_9EURY|nr:hypothetical protein [Candidatus Methanoperedens nitroreducens]KCZ72311.1 hypothetical protein ANME2D_01717 [Candidatus Methanoperedens nitroreducens]MDJ1420775.1 hypothetical protein [Candidatus Methanoperedens sp.]
MAAYGCKERKCPCRMWVNCLHYVNVQKRAWRLKRKEYDFHSWYRDNFRNEIQMVDVFVNG